MAKEKPEPPDSLFPKSLSTFFNTQAGYGQAIQPWSHITLHTVSPAQQISETPGNSRKYATIPFRVVKVRKHISRGYNQKLAFHMIITIILE